MLLYKYYIQRFSGDTLGVSKMIYAEKEFENEQEFEEYKKQMSEFDYDGSYAEIHVQEVRIND